jgi:hypothetical protein
VASDEGETGAEDAPPADTQTARTIAVAPLADADADAAAAATSSSAAAAAPAAAEGAAAVTAAVPLVRPKEAVSDPLLVREYVCQAIDDELTGAVTTTLGMLLRFQDKLHATDPAKARSKRRLVVGLRETVRALRTNKARCVVLAHNIEQIATDGGLDDLVQEICKLSQLKYNPMIEKHPDTVLEVRAAPGTLSCAARARALRASRARTRASEPRRGTAPPHPAHLR